jgi:glycine cleavage system H protein
MKFPENLKYTKDHEWTKLDGNIATVGITDHAQSSLGDIVFIDLPKVGRYVKKGEAFGVVESIKAVSDLYSPVDGKIIEVNSALVDSPGNINSNPYDESWMVKIEFTGSTDHLLDASAYRDYVKSLS